MFNEKIYIDIVEDIKESLPKSRSEAEIYLLYSIFPKCLYLVNRFDDIEEQMKEIDVDERMKESIISFIAANEKYGAYPDKTVLFSKYGIIDAIANTLTKDDAAQKMVKEALKENYKLFYKFISFLLHDNYYVKSPAHKGERKGFVERTVKHKAEPFKVYSVRLSYSVFQDFLNETTASVIIKYPAHSVVGTADYAEKRLF